jgi:hypothetical protein
LSFQYLPSQAISASPKLKIIFSASDLIAAFGRDMRLFLFAGDKQDSIMSFMPFENVLSQPRLRMSRPPANDMRVQAGGVKNYGRMLENGVTFFAL